MELHQKRERCRYRRRDEGGYLRARRWRDYAGEATTIAAELAMPDLDQIKQVEQGVRDWRGRFARVRSGNPTFARAIETSYFEQRLQHIEDDCSNQPDTVTGKYSAGAG